MNELTQNSQGLSAPKTKSHKIFELISKSNVLITSSVVVANLGHALDVFTTNELETGKADTLDALLTITINHLHSIDSSLDAAISIYNLTYFQLCKKQVNNLLLLIQSFCICTLTYDHKSDFIYGFYLTALRLEEFITSLEDVVIQSEGHING